MSWINKIKHWFKKSEQNIETEVNTALGEIGEAEINHAPDLRKFEEK